MPPDRHLLGTHKLFFRSYKLDEALDVGSDDLLAVCCGWGCLEFSLIGVTMLAVVFMGVSSLALAVVFHAMRGMYLHAEGLLAKAGVARRNGEGYLPPLEKEPQVERKGRSVAEFCTSAARKIGETLVPRDRGSAPERT